MYKVKSITASVGLKMPAERQNSPM